MPPLSLVILYVDSPVHSADFYRRLLRAEPLEQAPTFSMFPLPGGTRLGLWSRHTVEPAAAGTDAGLGGGTELAFNAEDVDAVHAEWAGLGLPILQPPTELDFGRTFVALDPDGHRLRVFKPSPS